MQMPSHLYKYRSLAIGKDQVNVKNILINSQIYFPKPEQLNDPFEFRFLLSFSLADEDTRKDFLLRGYQERYPDRSAFDAQTHVRSILEDWRNRSPADLDRELRSVLEKAVRSDLHVLSLSETRSDILSWSHYADSHKGICIEFKVTGDDSFFGRAQSVKYSSQFPRLDFFQSDEEEKLKKTALTKALNWSYEKEWRIVDFEKGDETRKFPMNLLTGVILGHAVSDECKEFILDCIRRRDEPISLYQAKLKSDTYGLEIVQL